MRYIAAKRFKQKGICGDMNIPALSVCEEIAGVIYFNCRAVCLSTCENAHTYFANDEDGNGMERYKLIANISDKITSEEEEERQKLLDIMSADSVCVQYRRSDAADVWLWNHAFYNASIDDLTHIAKLVGA
jgi:hypothetical protein